MKSIVIFSFLFYYFFSFSVQNVKIEKDKLFRPVPINHQVMKKLKRGGGSLISERVGEYILRSQSLTENKKYDKAIELLEYHYNRVKQFSPFERANLAVHIALTYRQKEAKQDSIQKKNRKKALEYFQKALDSEALDYNTYLSSLYHVAQIYVEDDQTEKGFEALKKWFSVNEKPHPSGYILLAGVYFSKGNLEESLKYVEQTLRLVPQPKENWLQFAAAIHMKDKDYKKAKPYLERLAALFPNKSSHWRQLAGVYLYLNDNKKAFVTLDIAYKMGHLKRKTELLNLASLYVDQELPYQAGVLLEKSMNQNIISKEQKHLEFIAEAFYIAREGGKSLKYLKEASQKATNSKFFLKYGQRLLDEEKWRQAEAVFRKVLTKKDVKQSLESIKSYKRSLAGIKGESKWSGSKNSMRVVTSATEKIKEEPKWSHLKNSSFHLASQEAEIQQLQAPPTNQLEKIYLYLGIAVYNQEKPKKALSYFKKSIEINDTFLNAYQWIDFAEARLLETKQASL